MNKNSLKGIMTKQFKALTEEELAKLSIKEQQDYLARLKKDREECVGLIVRALNHGLKHHVKTL